jgi:hypothetical protein
MRVVRDAEVDEVVGSHVFDDLDLEFEREVEEAAIRAKGSGAGVCTASAAGARTSARGCASELYGLCDATTGLFAPRGAGGVRHDGKPRSLSFPKVVPV